MRGYMKPVAAMTSGEKWLLAAIVGGVGALLFSRPAFRWSARAAEWLGGKTGGGPWSTWGWVLQVLAFIIIVRVLLGAV